MILIIVGTGCLTAGIIVGIFLGWWLFLTGQGGP